MKLTQQDVADRLNQSLTTYKGWEQDRSKPRTFSIISKLCALLHITLDHYINGCDNSILSLEHTALMHKYDQLTPEVQIAVHLVLDTMIEKKE